MNKVSTSIENIGWNIENSYLSLPNHCYAKTQPSPVEKPFLVIKNIGLAEELSLNFDQVDDESLAQLFCGNLLPEGAIPISQAYAGHQFGNFTILGDGRAHMICEHVKPDGSKIDIQLKGSGRTPYSRGGDGKGALGPMLREYLISEAMHGLGVPTTRSLAVVATGEPVIRQNILPGAVLSRVAASHLRVGTFQFFAAHQDHKTLKQIADFAIQRHYPEILNSEQRYVDFLGAVMQRQIDLIVNWMRVGFIHGVMNTDNMAISGETIDYGPCAFMDTYDPKTVFSSIDYNGRYAFANQAPIANWNLARFAETLLPVIDDDSKAALKKAEDIIYSFNDRFETAWLEMMKKKLGLFGNDDKDKEIVDRLLSLMSKHEMDYTNTFRYLSNMILPDHMAYQTEEFVSWQKMWKDRQAIHQPSHDASMNMMFATNPAIIPRNHKVEKALEAAESEADLSLFNQLIEVLAKPYEDRASFMGFTQPPSKEERIYQTFCGT